MAKQKAVVKGKHPGGRPTKYKPELCLTVEYMARTGMTDVAMAEKLGITEQTLSNWKKAHPEFFASLKKGKEEPDAEVERKLFERATGYSHNAVKIFMPAGAKEPVYAPYTEHYPPDTTAMIFWLKNRKPQEWRDKQVMEHEVSEDTGLVVISKKLSEDEWKQQQKLKLTEK